MGKIRIYNKEFSEKCIHNGLGRKKYNIKKAIELLKPSKKDTILDIGCDNGELVEKLTPFVKKAIGIDLNKELIETLHNKNILYMDATKLRFPNESFDKIVCLHTLEHIKNLKKAFQKWRGS